MRVTKNSFSRLSPKVSILEHMLLHNFNINVAIANILVGRISFLLQRGAKYKNFHTRIVKKGRGPKQPYTVRKKWEYGLFCFIAIKTSICRWEIAFNMKCQREPFFVHLGSDYNENSLFYARSTVQCTGMQSGVQCTPDCMPGEKSNLKFFIERPKIVQLWLIKGGGHVF